MEDNNAINKQPTSVENINVEEVLKANKELQQAAEHWYNKAKQLENTWALSRLNFLFEFAKLDGVSSDIKEKTINEIDNLLFPKVENKDNKTK